MLPQPDRPVSPQDIHQSAATFFGFEHLRPGQLEVISDVIGGKQVVAIMPTGAGKSLCYQLPAVMLGNHGGVCLVISPLIALMKDQVDSLRAKGIPAAALTSAMTPDEQNDILEGIRAGVFTLLYVAPERFRSSRFTDALAGIGDRLALLAVDEAHCISVWGHDFRPDYRRIGQLVTNLQPPRLIALTATATPEVRQDIAAQLCMDEPRFHVRGFDRPNLQLAIEHAGGTADKCLRLVEKVRMRDTGVALVYAATRKNAERYGAALAEAGMRTRVYHAGLDDAQRVDAQEAFMADRLDAIVATNAFGMGVDKADIRLVIHADVPRSPEAYYQEVGRGGRDGRPTQCALLFNHGDIRVQEFLIDASYPKADVLRGLWKTLRQQPCSHLDLERLQSRLPGSPHAMTIRSAVRILARHGFIADDGDSLSAVRPGEHEDFPPLDPQELEARAENERHKLRMMVEYVYYPRCRRQYLLDYFGDEDWQQRDQSCKGCDNCLGTGQTQEISDSQRKSVRDLLALVARLSGRFGRTKFAALATATDDDERFSDLPERGVMAGQPARQALDLLRALEGAGYLEVSRGEYPTISITRSGKKLAKDGAGLDTLALVLPKRAGKAGKRKSTRSKSATTSAAPTMATHSIAEGPIDDALADRLRQLRSALASEQSVPAYVIFSNKTLDALARARPATTDELATVPGIGPNRLAAYGDKILATIRTA